jgi:hypothetical protein
MRKNKLGSILIYFFVLSLVMIPASCKNVELQLGFILDGSGSISATNWNLMVKGLSSIVTGGTFPKDGSVELTIVQVGAGQAKVVVGPVVVTAASASSIATDISKIAQLGGGTPLACGFICLADAMFNSPDFISDKKQIINIITDGEPNECCDNLGSYSVTTPCSNAQTSTETARSYAVSKLQMTMDKDLITCEFVGTNVPVRNWLRDAIVWPQEGTIAPPYIINHGWVRTVSTFTDLEAAINEKIKAIVLPKKSKKVASTQINQINQNINQNTMGMSGIGGLRTGSLWLSQNGVNIANVNGSNNQISQNINQNALGTARPR